MKKLIIVYLILFANLKCIGQERISFGELNEYKRLNDSEKRLMDFKDSDSALELKLLQLEIINASRKEYKASPVKLDILASRVANKMCTESAHGSYIGHYNTRGEKPYHRYAFAGGLDHVSENAAGEMFTGYYKVNNQTILAMMKDFHSAFMREKAPHDGHKQTVIEKVHNHVGIGFYLDNHQFRYYEEYIDRYYEFEGVPQEVKVNQDFTFKVITQDYLCFLIAYWERIPGKMSASAISRAGDYADFTDNVMLQINPVDIKKYKQDNTYTFPMRFDKAGLYYIQIYMDDKEYKGGNFTTEGKIQASGIIIKVSR